MSNQPEFVATAKAKASGNQIELLAFWRNGKGYLGGKPHPDIESIRLVDGRTIKPDSVWFNLYENKPEPEKAQNGDLTGVSAKQSKASKPIETADEIPF